MIPQFQQIKTNIKAYIDKIGQKYITGKAVRKNDIKLEVITKHRALPVMMNNYMLRLLETYKEEAQAEYNTTLALLNTATQEQRIELNTVLYTISTNISTIDKAIQQYQQERQELDIDMRSSLGIIAVKIPKAKIKK